MRNTDDPNLGLDPLDAVQAPLSAKNKGGSQQTDETRPEGPIPTKPSSLWLLNMSIGMLSLLMLGMLGWHFYQPLQRHLITSKASSKMISHAAVPTSASVSTRDPLVSADHARVQVLEQSMSDFTRQTAAQFKTLQDSIASINATQQQVATALNTLQSASSQNNTADLNTTMATLQVELAQLKSEIDALKTEKRSSNALPATALPFQALSVNSWGGVPYVLVRTDSEEALVRQGDAVHGWTLSSVDYPTQTVVFEDGQHRLVRLVL